MTMVTTEGQFIGDSRERERESAKREATVASRSRDAKGSLLVGDGTRPPRWKRRGTLRFRTSVIVVEELANDSSPEGGRPEHTDEGAESASAFLPLGVRQVHEAKAVGD